MSCPGDGADYYGQDGNFEIDKPTYSVNGAVVTDSVLGLAWRLGNAQTSHSGASAACQGSGFGWRVPTFLELLSLMDYGASIDAVPATFAKQGPFWAAETAPEAGTGWTFTADTGLPIPAPGSTLVSVLCVSGQPISGAMGKPFNGTVQDGRTGLHWQTGTTPAETWKDALKYCKGAQGAGFATGWRLPSVKELLTIAKTDSKNAIDLNVFNSAVPVWTSSPVATDGSKAWLVDFNPLTVTATAVTATAEVRCVHGPS